MTASPTTTATRTTKRMRMNQAISLALRDEMAADDTVVCYGEDVANAGGVFKTSVGLLEEFGSQRVRDTPISEMAILGSAVGAATAGLRPVVEIMFVEFFGVCLDQMVTQAAKLHFLTNGAVTVPLVARASVGAGRGFSATHSQTCETWFLATPGLKIVHVSGAASAYGLLRSAIQDDNPVVFLEPKTIYGTRAEVAIGDDALIPLGQAATLRSGADVTLISLGQLVNTCLAAADTLAEAGIAAEVIDLQTLKPWDRDAVLASVGRTKRAVIVEENPFTGGWGTMLATEINTELFGVLDAPVHRITTPDTPVPFSKDLELTFLPSTEYVNAQVTELCQTNRSPQPWWEPYL